jgi:hypothetical protein
MQNESFRAKQVEIHDAATNFLKALAEAGAVEGVAGRPTVSNFGSGMVHGFVSITLGDFERALNPRRLRYDDPEFGKTVIGLSSTPSLIHQLELLHSLSELRDGLRAILSHWKADGYWGCGSWGIGGTLSPGASYRPEHFHFPGMEDGRFTPVPRRIFEAMVIAVERLREFIQLGTSSPDPPPPPKGRKKQKQPFVPSPTQVHILNALDGKALKQAALVKKTGISQGQLHPKNKTGLTELRDLGYVDHHPRVGYYRPDAPPPELRGGTEK